VIPFHVPTGDDHGGDLTPLLWIVATLLALLDAAWWFVDRVFPP
jgi:hypothetical protein